MKKRFVRYVKRLGHQALLWLFACLSAPALAAGLPKMEDPSRGQGKGIFETMKNYLYDGAIFGGLLISTVSFMVVAWYAVSVFTEVQRGKKTWADFGMVVMVGVLLVVACIWLLTKAADIL